MYVVDEFSAVQWVECMIAIAEGRRSVKKADSVPAKEKQE